MRGVNPKVVGEGGNTLHPPPVQLGCGDAPVPPTMLPLGEASPSGIGGNTSPSPPSAAVGNDTDQDCVANLTDHFQKILRTEQEGLSPELTNQSPQEKHLRALSLLDKHSLGRMKDKELAKAVHQASKTEESWLQA